MKSTTHNWILVDVTGGHRGQPSDEEKILADQIKWSVERIYSEGSTLGLSVAVRDGKVEQMGQYVQTPGYKTEEEWLKRADALADERGHVALAMLQTFHDWYRNADTARLFDRIREPTKAIAKLEKRLDKLEEQAKAMLRTEITIPDHHFSKEELEELRTLLSQPSHIEVAPKQPDKVEMEKRDEIYHDLEENAMLLIRYIRDNNLQGTFEQVASVRTCLKELGWEEVDIYGD